jgi:glucosamine--fructose-6-phosphate aminotransferase (isomerizing)
MYLKKFIGRFTLEEILSQPETWERTLTELSEIDFSSLPKLSDYDAVIFTGCGSTYYLSIWAARLVRRIQGINAEALPASELWYSSKSWISPYKKVLLVAVSRSGDTSETLQAVKIFNDQKIGKSISITCYPESELPRLSHQSIITSAGQEKSIVQTRSFSNMMLAAYFLIYGGAQGGAVVTKEFSKEFKEFSKEFIDKYREKAVRIGRDLRLERFFFLGDGPLFGLASETMLKMKEMSLSYSEAYHFLEFRHGPMSMINNQSLVIALLSDFAMDFELGVVKDMKKIGAKILAVGPNGAIFKDGKLFDYAFPIEDHVPRTFYDLLYLPLLQLVAFERSLSKGLNPDKPHNLSAVVKI